MWAQVFRITFLPALFLLTACGEPPEPENQNAGQTFPNAEIPAVIRDQVDALSTTVCDSAEGLKTNITTFLNSPNPETLSEARAQWRQAHQSYARLMVAYNLAEREPPHIEEDRDTQDAFPMLSGYLDRVPGYPRSGIVYSEVPLTPDFLRSEHQSTDFLYLTLGFHPLETMLWGSADQGTEERAKLYVQKESVAEDKVDSHARRAELLRLIAHRLSRDARVHCPAAGLETLMRDLTLLADNKALARQAIARALETLIEPRLSAWQNNPGGEDRNGMPVWHAPFAKTDFTEMASQVDALQTRWLTALMPDAREAESDNTLENRFSALAERLNQHADAGNNQTVDGITLTRDELNVLIAALSPPPQLEESAQSNVPADQVNTKEQALGPLDSEESRE
ncbi:MAG: imelysin family protein [Marinobacter sp.]|uniref:imelysin family protein n=1 Tax=Marinobacter sp. TaxID=50741 RepID=UPI0034A08C7D